MNSERFKNFGHALNELLFPTGGLLDVLKHSLCIAVHVVSPFCLVDWTHLPLMYLFFREKSIFLPKKILFLKEWFFDSYKIVKRERFLRNVMYLLSSEGSSLCRILSGFPNRKRSKNSFFLLQKKIIFLKTVSICCIIETVENKKEVRQNGTFFRTFQK